MKKPADPADEESESDRDGAHRSSKEAPPRGRSTRQKTVAKPVRDSTSSIDEHSDADDQEEDKDELSVEEEQEDDYRPTSPLIKKQHPLDGPVARKPKPSVRYSTTGRQTGRPVNKALLIAPQTRERGIKRPLEQDQSDTEEEEEQEVEQSRAQRRRKSVPFAEAVTTQESQDGDQEEEEEEEEEEEVNEEEEFPRPKQTG